MKLLAERVRKTIGQKQGNAERTIKVAIGSGDQIGESRSGERDEIDVYTGARANYK